MNPWMPSCAGSKGNPSSGSTCRKWLPRPSSARGGLPAVRKHSQGECPFAVAPVSSWPIWPSTDARVDRQSTGRSPVGTALGVSGVQDRIPATLGTHSFLTRARVRDQGKASECSLHSRSEGCMDTHPVLLRWERTPSGPAHGSLHTASGSHRSPRALGKAGM